jgi:ankyrin repeat protein
MTTWKCGTPRRGAAFGVHRVKKGQVDVVCLLLDQGSEEKKKKRNGSRRTELAVASRYGKLEVANLRGADVNSRDKKGWTPLHRHLQVVLLLT